MKKLDDGNIIILENGKLKIIYIEGNKINEVSEIETKSSTEIHKLSNDNILTRKDYVEEKTIYLYNCKNGKIKYDKYFNLNSIIKRYGFIQDICDIKKNQIAITYGEEGLMLGWNHSLIIYDLVEQQKKEVNVN